MDTVCFTGHRPNGLNFDKDDNGEGSTLLKIKLLNEIEYLINEGVEAFIVGMAMGVDIWCGEIVNSLKEYYPNIHLEGAVPYRKHGKKWNYYWKNKHNELLKNCDKITYINENYKKGVMQDRNKYMVHNSTIVLGVWNGKKSGTYNTLKYANKLGKKIIIIEIDNGDIKDEVVELRNVNINR